MDNNIWTTKVWVFTTSFPGRAVPLIYLQDGRPCYTLNQYIYYLIDENITPASLEDNERALRHIYAFTVAMYGDKPLSKQLENLVGDFIYAKRFGTDEFCTKKANDPKYGYLVSLGLHWPKTKRKTIKKYIRAINRFDVWQAAFHGATRLNPCELRFKNAFEIYSDYKQRKGWDPLIHLFSTYSQEKTDYQNTVEQKFEHKGQKSEKKAGAVRPYDPHKFIELVDSCCNPRDKMLMLLMGGGSLRGSETLHLWFSDVAKGVNDWGEALIRLDNPENGVVEWSDDKGRRSTETRTEHFARAWQNTDLSLGNPLRNLMPRTQYGERNKGLSVGFKAMTFAESDGGTFIDGRLFDQNYLWWIDPRIGGYFYKCYIEYMEEYIWTNYYSKTKKSHVHGWPHHPWLFIMINKKDYGMPLTYDALEKIWTRR